MPQSYYTPFLSSIGAAVGQGLKDRGLQQQQQERNKLIQSAYMEQPGAMAQLQAVDPQAAASIQSQKRQEKQAQLEERKFKASEQDRTREILMQNKELVEKTLLEAAKLETIEEAQKYVDSVVSQNHELLAGAKIQPLTPEMFMALKGRAKTTVVSQVQSSRQMPGGLVQIVRKDGTVDLVEPEKAESELIKAAEIRGAELQGLRSGERKAGEESIKESVKAFQQITPLRKSISNYDEAIQLIDEGAETGVIAARLPTVREASIKLDNLQAQMGLDVIGQTTFGALSESELAFALDSALPKKLEGPALRGWLKEKRDAQIKLIDYLNDAAVFMGTPGNTIADFINKQKSEEEARKKAQKPISANAEPPQMAAQQTSVQQITSDTEYESLPPGTEFIAPDGSLRRKP